MPAGLGSRPGRYFDASGNGARTPVADAADICRSASYLVNDALNSGFVANLAFPYHDEPPAHRPEICLMPTVTRGIALQFRAPEVQTTLGHACQLAVRIGMLMPHATANLYGDPARRKHDVGPPREALVVQPVTQTRGMESAPDAHLGLGVLSFDQCHLCRTGRIRQDRITSSLNS